MVLFYLKRIKDGKQTLESISTTKWHEEVKAQLIADGFMIE